MNIFQSLRFAAYVDSVDVQTGWPQIFLAYHSFLGMSLVMTGLLLFCGEMLHFMIVNDFRTSADHAKCFGLTCDFTFEIFMYSTICNIYDILVISYNLQNTNVTFDIQLYE